MAELKRKRMEALLEACENWLQPDNHYLADAIERTGQEGYFSIEDVKHAVQAIEKSLDETAVEEWAKQAGLTDENDARGQNALCLHAGNLPLVGFHDAFATLLSGARYSGKISRKDPYLLPTFLNEVKKREVWTDVTVQWSHRLDDFEDMQHDAIIFAGSESSVPGVRRAIAKWNLARDESRYLIRTSHFSMAYFNSRDERTMENLVNGIFRYGGKGCRSVAIVVSPFALDAVKSELAGRIEAFWLENPQHWKPSPKLKQQYAYNTAIERSQLWLDYFLLQEDGLEFDQDFICYWVRGGEGKAAELVEKYGEELQSVYVSHSDVQIGGFEGRAEPLSGAQRPPISWRPDGVDTLQWLTGSGEGKGKGKVE